ncbi:ROK family transcriptional regulator [Jeotgalibacillus soli]|uniref:ROK family protein n=1 Tax=Jeotgalibacillus soli TaxID=889306 RepID=A0A0C2R6A6_9BACL|nr:ROK family transcriptional regulator [Jeotgalibacillus soli]KIL45790.1 ROK family protein [Jeotgalibacillus soli]
MTQNKTSTPNYLKYLNKKKVLRYIQQNKNVSRADVASALLISKPTVSSVVEELIAEGWVEERESDTANSAGGRKPIQLSFNANKQYIAAVDIGGTHVELGILNMNGELLIRDRFETQLSSETLVDQICVRIQKIISKVYLTLENLMAIGVGAPGITDTRQGIVLEAPSLGWMNYPLKEEIEKSLNIPVYIDNDVNVSVLGEQWKGKAKEADNIILISLGTGVGCGIIVNGQLYRGSSFAAGEIGYMVTDKNEAKQGYNEIFEGYGFLDSHVGGPSIVQRMKTKLVTGKDNQNLRNHQELTAKHIFQLAKENNPAASEVIEETLDHIAFALVNVICIFNPQYVILGGGISKSGNWFLPKVQEILAEQLPFTTNISITELDGLSLIGAAALCLQEHDSILKN